MKLNLNVFKNFDCENEPTNKSTGEIATLLCDETKSTRETKNYANKIVSRQRVEANLCASISKHFVFFSLEACGCEIESCFRRPTIRNRSLRQRQRPIDARQAVRTSKSGNIKANVKRCVIRTHECHLKRIKVASV